MSKRLNINTMISVGALVSMSTGFSTNASAQFFGGAVFDAAHYGVQVQGHAAILKEWQKLHQELKQQYDLLDKSHNTLEEIRKSNEKIQELTEKIEEYIKEIKESMIGPMYESLIDAGADGEEARIKLSEIYAQDSGSLGLGLSENEGSLDAYADKYGFLKAETLYGSGEGLYTQRKELTDSVYFAGYAVQETLSDMSDRYTRYDDIEAEMGSTENQKGRETLANILALENGRAITKIMELQNIKINLKRQRLSQQIGEGDSKFTIWGIKN